MERVNNYAIAAAQARQHFSDYDQRALAEKLGAELDDSYLYTVMLSRCYRVHRKTGDISKSINGVWIPANGFEETMTLLDLVCDSRENRFVSGRWKTMSAFGGQVHGGLLERSEPWARFLEDHSGALDAVCRELNGNRFPQGNIAYAIPLFEGLSVVLQLWYGDEEFPANLRWLWDENALMYLKYETMYYAIGLIRSEIQARMAALIE